MFKKVTFFCPIKFTPKTVIDRLSSMGLFLTLTITGYGQILPSSFNVTSQVPASNYVANGVTGSGDLAGQTYSMNYGQNVNSQPGINRIIQQFVVNGASHTYVPVPQLGNLPYNRVIINQVALGVSGAEQDTEKEISFSENAQAENDLYMLPEHAFTMENVINSFTSNRGIDNAFANIDGATINTVERIDMVYDNGITASDVNKSGFLVLERGGNDIFKVAAITSLNQNGTVASLGNLVTVDATGWQSTGIDISSVVLQKTGAATDWHPTQFLDSQPISGTYLSLGNLGIASGVTIYGYALFPGDVTDDMDLLGLTNVPGDTPASGTGGLDYMGGGGFFIALVNVAGNIYNDADGGNVNGNPTNGAGLLYVSLVKDGVVYATQKVADDGSYLFTNVEEDEYSVVIHTTPEGSLTPQLPSANWVYTGEGVGPSNPGTTPDGTINGVTQITVGAPGTPDITDVNFGIEQIPTAAAQAYFLATQPAPGSEIILNGTGTGTGSDNVIPGPLRGSDPEDQATTGSLNGKEVVITKLPENGELYYNNVLITATDVPFTIENYNPDLLKVKLTGVGYTSISFDYAYVDANGEQSSDVSYTINFGAALPVKLIAFEVSREAANANLRWSTSSETNSARFEIQHSQNARDWKNIGSVMAQQESETTKTYSFVHTLIPSGLNYYRLKMVDRDETFAYSKLLSLNASWSDETRVYPNPAVANSVKIETAGKIVEEVKIYNNTGVLLATPKVHENTVDLENIPTGIYILAVTYSDGITLPVKISVQ